jgi:c-di-GMP-binding flagellar brake protein YcgR
MIDRRRNYRLVSDIRASCFVLERPGAAGRPFEARLLDVSAGGTRLESEEVLENGARILVEFTLRDLVIASEGIVTRRETSGEKPQYGIAFQGLTIEERGSLDRRILDCALLRERADDGELAETSPKSSPLADLHAALSGWVSAARPAELAPAPGR